MRKTYELKTELKTTFVYGTVSVFSESSGYLAICVQFYFSLSLGGPVLLGAKCEKDMELETNSSE